MDFPSNLCRSSRCIRWLRHGQLSQFIPSSRTGLWRERRYRPRLSDVSLSDALSAVRQWYAVSPAHRPRRIRRHRLRYASQFRYACLFDGHLCHLWHCHHLPFSLSECRASNVGRRLVPDDRLLLPRPTEGRIETVGTQGKWRRDYP